MVSRIEVIPTEVRGYGNIVMAKSLSDFVPVESDLVYSENVYSLTVVSGVHISLTASSSSINVGSSVTLTATVMEDDTPVTGETVSFYDGETLLGTDATDSSGVATYSTSSLTVGAHSLSAVYGEKTSNLVNVTVNKITSTLSISVSSSSISYGDSVTISGTLSVGSGESVKVYQGNTLLDTVTTSTGGAYSKTVSGLSVGAYSFHTVYDGDSTHSEVSSSNVNVTVNKLTPTITLSVPSTGTVGTSYSITGTLVPSSGSVKLYENGSLKDTLTVSSGTFSKAITQSNEGTYSYYVVFEGSSTYDSITSSTSSIVVSDTPAPTPASVSLTSDKSILSYADSQSATLSATVLDSGSNPLEGVTVEFFKGSTSLGTASTNSSGVATKSYASAGVGDISLTAEVGSLVSETYALEDCYLYDDATSDKSSNYTKTSSLSVTYSTDHYVLSNSAQNQFLNVGEDYDNVAFEVEAKLIQPATAGNAGFGLMDTTNSLKNTAFLTIELSRTQFLTFSNGNYSTSGAQNITKDSSKYYKYIVTVNGNSVNGKVYDGETQLYNQTVTKTLSKKYYNIGLTSNNTIMHIKKIKVKAL